MQEMPANELDDQIINLDKNETTIEEFELQHYNHLEGE